MADPSSIIPSLPFQNINEMIIFGMLVVSGFIYLFYWRTDKKFSKETIKFEFDVLLFSLVFSSIFIIITLGTITTLNMMTVSSMGKMLFPDEKIISFDFLAYEYAIVLFFIIFLNQTKVRRWIDSSTKKFYEKGLGFHGLVIGIVVMGLVGLYFSNMLINISIVILLITFCFILIPLLIVIEITKRLLKNKSLI
ncbi:MAG: hypothetical protein NTU57_04335 [Candidatus Aenigmarchaeota archaeon]|nr:hypothetical protein [Candidatus Aenigmarchaeota archaeon]